MAKVFRKALPEPVVPVAPATPAGPTPYELALAELAKPEAAAGPMFTPEQVEQRQTQNDSLVHAGLVGQLSQDKAISGVGGGVFKQALAARQPVTSKQGILDPLTGQLSESPEYKDEKAGAKRDRVLKLALDYSDKRQRAAERQQQIDDQQAAREDSIRLAASLRQGVRNDASGLKAQIDQARLEGIQSQNDARNAKVNEARDKSKLQAAHAGRRADFLTGELDRAEKLVGNMTTGLVGSQMRKVPGTDAYDLNKVIDTIKANIGFEELRQMRLESPTGGALGQVAIKELDMLQATLGNLDTAQDPDTIRANIKAIKGHFKTIKESMDKAQKELEALPPAGTSIATPSPAARPAPGAAGVGASPGGRPRTATHPQTGEKLMLQNGEWVPAK
jgi:hypothetical protein